jgi:hypothetical protein
VETESLTLAVVDVLERQQVPYMLVGSFSSNLFGVPRSTKDLDIVVELGAQSIHDVTLHLDARFRLQPQMAFESVTGTARHIIDVQGTQFKIEIFRLSGDAHDQARFGRRIQYPWAGRMVWVPTPEDVIVVKLRWLAGLRRSKDFEDSLQVATIRRDSLDWGYLEHWCNEHGTREILEELRAKAFAH